jgi:nitroreductase
MDTAVAAQNKIEMIRRLRNDQVGMKVWYTGRPTESFFASSVQLVCNYFLSGFTILFMKKLLLLIIFGTIILLHSAAAEDTTAISVILNNFGARNYAAGVIPNADMDKIIAAGIRAPSASNRQPWLVTVVSTPALTAKLMNNLPEGNVLVIVSSDSDSREHFLDCALAIENIYLAAQALGYGSRIYVGPVSRVNGSLKKELGIPQERSVVAIIRVGRLAENIDAATSASPRKSANDIVTYK